MLRPETEGRRRRQQRRRRLRIRRAPSSRRLVPLVECDFIQYKFCTTLELLHSGCETRRRRRSVREKILPLKAYHLKRNAVGIISVASS